MLISPSARGLQRLSVMGKYAMECDVIFKYKQVPKSKIVFGWCLKFQEQPARKVVTASTVKKSIKNILEQL